MRVFVCAITIINNNNIGFAFGDNVGDGACMGVDLLESFAGGIIASIKLKYGLFFFFSILFVCKYIYFV